MNDNSIKPRSTRTPWGVHPKGGLKLILGYMWLPQGNQQPPGRTSVLNLFSNSNSLVAWITEPATDPRLGSILLTSLVAVDILGSLLEISKKVLGFFKGPATRWRTFNIELEIFFFIVITSVMLLKFPIVRTP